MSEIKVNLPKTKLAMKANLPNKEPDILKYWDTINLYELQKKHFQKEKNLFFMMALHMQMETYILEQL